MFSFQKLQTLNPFNIATQDNKIKNIILGCVPEEKRSEHDIIWQKMKKQDLTPCGFMLDYHCGWEFAKYFFFSLSSELKHFGQFPVWTSHVWALAEDVSIVEVKFNINLSFIMHSTIKNPYNKTDKTMKFESPNVPYLNPA